MVGESRETQDGECRKGLDVLLLSMVSFRGGFLVLDSEATGDEYCEE